MSQDINEQIIEKSKELRDKVKKTKNMDFPNLILEDDFSEIHNRCCENILGYKKVPMGISHNPILINGSYLYVPICTFEGALVASMCRGIKLINKSDGIQGIVENIGITRSIAIEFSNFEMAIGFYRWIRDDSNLTILKKAGERNSRYTKIKAIESRYIFGKVVYIKVTAYTGDAMGMNMITKACNQIYTEIQRIFPEVKLITISANICTDKKQSIENYANGRGRKVFLNIKIKENDLMEIMKVSIDSLLDVYHTKIVLGGSITLGGFNSQAANYVAATYLAFNQDLGHVIESSNCILDMKRTDGILEVNLMMPSIVCGTIGGGTHLEPARSLFKQFEDFPDPRVFKDEEDLSSNSNVLALLVASAVLAGELSVLASLADNTLMKAHLKLNRK